MDRASDSGSEGWGFESLPVYQINKRDTHPGIPLIYFALRAGRDSKDSIAICRWHIAATSSKTGCYLNFCPSHARAKMQTSPFRCTKKEVTFVYQKLLLFLSKPQAWHIITARSVVHIISPFGDVSHHAPACILLRLDEMQHCVLMICNSDGIDDIQGFALIALQNYDILLLDKLEFD